MESRVCEFCGSEFSFRPRPGKAGRFCAKDCYVEWQRAHPRPWKVKGRWYLMASQHPIAPPTGAIPRARLVLYDKIGPGVHSCHWCGRKIQWRQGLKGADAIIADHLDWDGTNDTPANLVPSCHRCNAHRRRNGKSRPLAEDDVTVVYSGVRTRAIERTCATCGETFLTIPAGLKHGRGKYCSRDCMYRRHRVSSRA